MRYVTSFGGLWKVSDANYKQLLDAVEASGPGDVNLDHFGRMIGTVKTLDQVAEEAKEIRP